MNPAPPSPGSSGPTGPDEAQAGIAQTVACPRCRADVPLNQTATSLRCPSCGTNFAPPPPASVKPMADLVSASGKKLWTVGTLTYTTSALILLFFWLLFGDFALSMRDRSVGPLTEKFLLQQGSSNTLKQILTSFIPTGIALLLSPIVSFRSDRMRGRWGRRIPFLMIPTPIAGLAMVGIAFSPQIGRWLYEAMGNTITIHNLDTLRVIGKAVGPWIYQSSAPIVPGPHHMTIGVFTAFWIVFEVAVIISGAVMGGLINDVVPRPVLGRFFGLFRAISLFDGILFNALLFKHAEQHFTLMFALIGVFFAGGFMIMCLTVKEGQYPPPPADEAAVSGRALGPLARFWSATLTYLRECFAQPYYLLLFAMFTLGAVTFRPINDFSYRYAVQLGMPDAVYGNFIAVSYLVSLSIAFPLGMLVDRFHPLRMAIVAILLYVATMVYGAFFVKDAATFGIAFLGHTILSGTYFTCTASLGQALFPRSKFSQYASAGGLITSVTMLILAPTLGKVLDLTDDWYHLTFWLGLIFAVMTLLLTFGVYGRFSALGGTTGYLAPGDEAAERTRLERPAHMVQVIALYLVGAIVGLACGYVASYLWFAAKPGFPYSLANFHLLLFKDKDACSVAIFCGALGVIPGGILGAWAGSSLTKRTPPAGAPAH